MSVSTSQPSTSQPSTSQPSTSQQRLYVVHEHDAEGANPWWQGVWFEGAMDPRGTLFAVALAVGATAGLVVLVTAAVRIVTGA